MSENFNWKGKTLNQVLSKIQLNKGNINDIYGPTPIKLYRREFASNTNTDDEFTSGNQRTSVKIDEINRPGGSIVVSNNTNNTNNACINSVIIVESEKNAVEEEINALRRVRNSKSSIIYDENNPVEEEINALRRVRNCKLLTIEGENVGEYFADTKQYLKSRGKTFEDNLTYIVKVEDSSARTNKLKFKTLTETVMSNSNRQNTDLLYAVPEENLKKKGGNPFPINSRERLKKLTQYIDETDPIDPIDTSPIFIFNKYIYNKSFLLNNSPLNIDNEFSVCFWLFPINNSGSNWYFYFNGISGNQQVYFSIKTDNNTDPEIYIELNGQRYYFPNMSFNIWYHITVVVSNNSSIRCYLNGISVLENSFNWNSGSITNAIFELGKSGIIDFGLNRQNIANAHYTDIRIYNNSLAVGDILSIYNSGNFSFENVINSSLIYHYNFNDGDYYVSNSIRYIRNIRNTDLNNILNDGTIKDNENTMIQLDKAFSFDENSFITANNRGLTVCFWIYPINNTGGEWIFNFTGINNTNQPIDLYIKSSNSIFNPGIYGSINNNITNFPVITYNKWYHISITVSQGINSKISYFLNGINIGDKYINFDVGTIVGNPTIGNPTIVNQEIFNNNNLTNAKFTDVRLYDTDITGGNILSIYKNGLGTFETVLYSNLLYQYRFYETDYSVIGNTTYVRNWGIVQNKKGKIINNIEGIILPTKLFYFDSSILPTNIGNQGMTVCFWMKLINNSGTNYLFNFTGNINNLPIKFSIKTLIDDNNRQIYIEINNSRTSYVNITYNQFYFITVSLFTDVITQKINFKFIINSGAYSFTIPTQINNGLINGLASFGYYVENSLLNSAYAKYANARLYNSVLTDQDIYFLYNNGIGTFNNISTVPLYEYRFFTNDYSIQSGSSNKYVRNLGSLQNTSGLLFETTTNISDSYNLITSYNVNTLDNRAFSLNKNFDVSFVNTGITVCFWVYPIAMDVSSSDWYFNFKGIIGGTNAISFSVKTTNNSITDPEFYLETNDVILNSPVAYYNSWNHITITGYESNNSPLKFYFNGEYVGNIQSQYTTGDISGVFQLGNSYTTNVLKSYCANAKYIDARLYRTVLGTVEIRQLYNSGAGTNNRIRNDSIIYQYLFNPNDFFIRNNITFVNNKATGVYSTTSGMVIPEPPEFQPLFSTGKTLFDCKWVNRSYTGPIFRLIDFSSNYPSSSFPNIDTTITSVINDGFNNLIDTNGNVILGKLQDFYVDSRDTIITTSPNGMGVALNDWLSFGRDKIYVDIWYDQTGNNNNATTNNSSLYARKYYDVDVNNHLKYIPFLDTSYRIISFSGTKFFTLQNGTVPYGNSSYTVSTRLSNINGRGDFLSSGNFSTNILNNFSTNTFKGNSQYLINLYCNYWDIKDFFISSQAVRQSDPINQSATFIHDGSNVVFNPNDLNLSNKYYKTNVYVDQIYDNSSNVYSLNPANFIDPYSLTNSSGDILNELYPLFSDISGVRIERTTREIILNNNNSNDNMNYRFNFIGANRRNTNLSGGVFSLSYFSGDMYYMWISETALDDTKRGIIENIGNS